MPRLRPNKILIIAFVVCVLFFITQFFSNRDSHWQQSNKGIGAPENDYDIVNNVGHDKIQNLNKGTLNEKIDHHNYTQEEEDSKKIGPGEQGQGVLTEASENKLKEELLRANGFNALASDKISLYRTLRDNRHKDCKTKKYYRNLPTVSLVIPFHEEHFSVLIRTVVSSISRAPPNVLKEIILVDDYSTKIFLKQQLDDYVKTNFSNVQVLRTTKREGLIRARIIGAKTATCDVIIFLDSHCEPNVNWLAPLLDPIVVDYRTITCPFIDVINKDTWAYEPQDEGGRGAFDWAFYYKRLPRLPEDASHPAEPFDSPVMAGGLFAISRKWFWELGGYDPGLDVWGGEQYELSFKLWQCGGRMIDVPCSRIGHAYRRFNPFHDPNAPPNYIKRNYKRVAEVWMDDYKKYLYRNSKAIYDSIDAGDLRDQLAIREKLKCKSFDWFMKHVAFDLPKYYPYENPPVQAEGNLKNTKSSLCIDTKFVVAHSSFGLDDCISEATGGIKNGEQHMELTNFGELKPHGRGFCFDAQAATGEHLPIILFPCHMQKGNQHWKYSPETHQVVHVATNMCLEAVPDTKQVFLARCQSTPEQNWSWTKVNWSLLHQKWLQGE